jgi:DNA adenine methylase
MAKTPPYPFIKWAGGKQNLARFIVHRLPESIDTYYEPMIGGGAILLKIRGSFKRAIISDTNPEVVNAWRVVKKDVEKLIRALRRPKFQYDKETFLKIRAQNPNKLSPVQRAARFIYLNKTCFNGLYRVNSQGQFNVPFGKYKDPVICDAENLRAVSLVLKNVKILSKDFADACNGAGKGDAIYFDPPYIPVSKTSSFTGYTATGFSEADHDRLAKLFEELGDRGARVVLTNSLPAINLYSKFDYDRQVGNRSIGGPAEYRGKAGELIIFHGPKT